MKKHGEHGPPSEKQRKLATKLIEEKIPDDEKENWYEQFDQAEDTWEMSMIIDRLMKLKK